MSVPVYELADSRAATDALLEILRNGRWRPGAVGCFLRMAAHRSLRQATRHPCAFVQAGALHGLLFTPARGPGARTWVATSWTLTVLHLGLLEKRDQLSGADVITILRGNLPATALGGAAGRACWRSPSTWPTAAWPAARAPCPRSVTTPTPSPTPPSGPGSYCGTTPAVWCGPRRSRHGSCPWLRSPPSVSVAAGCPTGPGRRCCVRPPRCRPWSPCGTFCAAVPELPRPLTDPPSARRRPAGTGNADGARREAERAGMPAQRVRSAARRPTARRAVCPSGIRSRCR